jgi:hypothetical protein
MNWSQIVTGALEEAGFERVMALRSQSATSKGGGEGMEKRKN